jgi:hypothetical protein
MIFGATSNYYPLGDARAALLAFASLLAVKTALGLERCEEDVIL